MENDGIASLLACGYTGNGRVALGWWSVGAYVYPCYCNGQALFAWFDWLPLVDTPLGLIGELIYIFPSPPSYHTMIKAGTFVPAQPGDVPWRR